MVLTQQEARNIIQNSTPEQYNQVYSLIVRGKGYATRGDTELERVKRAMEKLGLRSVEEMKRNKEAEVRREAKLTYTSSVIPSETSSGQQSQQLQQIEYYGEVSPAQTKAKQLRQQFLKRLAERVVQVKNKPSTALNYLPGSPEYLFMGAKGVQVGSSEFAKRISEEQSRLRTEIARENKPGLKQSYKKLSVQTLGVQKGIVRAVGDTAGLIALVPQLPEATYLFLKNQPINKTKNFLMNLPTKLPIAINKVKNQIRKIRKNPAEAVSYAMTQYFLFGGKLKTTKGQPIKNIEKFIIKDTTKTRTGLFFKWIKNKQPLLIKFRTNLNTNIKTIKTAINRAINSLKKTSGQSKTGVKYLDLGKIDRKPIPKPKPKGFPLPKPKGKVSKGDIEVTFKKSGWDSLPLKEQAKFIGKKLNLVSAQADRLVYLLRQSRLVQKPIAELKLSKKGISLLNKLNLGGRLTKQEIKLLDQEFKRTNKGLLEKSFFASPSTNVRVSRLGLRGGNAGLLDIFKGNFTLRRNKPQILFFRNQRIQKFPKELNTIRNKLISGRSLTQREATELLNFQLKKSGRFKPIGFVTREAEVTLAPGEIIHRVKRLGSVRIAGRKVPIIEAEVMKLKSKVTRDLMNRLNKGERLTLKEIKNMNKGIQRESGFKSSSYSSYSGKPNPYLSLKSKILSFSIYYKKGSSISYYPKGGSRYPKGGRGGRYPTGGRSPIIGSPGKYIPKPIIYPKGGSPGYPRGGGGSYPPKPPISPRPKPPIKKKPGFSSEFPYKSTNKFKVGYIVYGLSGRKWVKLNKKPLIKTDALARGSYAIDRTTAKTFKIVPILKVKKLGQILKREKGYYIKAGFKFREYRVKRGKAYALIMKHIEKRKYGIDTGGEKKGLSLARYLSKLKGGKY